VVEKKFKNQGKEKVFTWGRVSADKTKPKSQCKMCVGTEREREREREREERNRRR
jgi:hypothetical protein